MKSEPNSMPQRPFASRAACATLVLMLSFSARLAATEPMAAAPVTLDWTPAQTTFAAAVDEELKRGILPGLSVAWIVDGQVVHSAGYGLADWQTKKPATPETIYRAGSISKLFNAVAAMQLVEQGKLDLDAPIPRVAEFSIVNPFPDAPGDHDSAVAVPSLGNGSRSRPSAATWINQPSIEATLASVANCALVNPPNTKTRYSNVGPTIVGQAVEAVRAGYADYQQQHLLGPLGMTSSPG